MPVLGRKEKETSSNVEERLNKIEEKLEQILLLLSKTPIVENIEKKVIPVIAEVKKIKKVVFAPIIEEVIIKKEKKIISPVIIPVIIPVIETFEYVEKEQIPIIEQKKVFDPYTTNVEKLISSIERENKTLEQYILDLPEYALSYITIDDLFETVLDKFKDDHIYAGNLKTKYKYCFYTKYEDEWRRDNRAYDYTDSLQELLKNKYLNIAKSLYKNISEYDRAYNHKIICKDDNNDMQQVLQNLSMLCDKSHLFYMVHNHFSKQPNLLENIKEFGV